MKKKLKTDFEALDKLTDEEITRRAESDPDAQPLDDAFFATAKRVRLEDLIPETKKQVT